MPLSYHSTLWTYNTTRTMAEQLPDYETLKTRMYSNAPAGSIWGFWDKPGEEPDKLGCMSDYQIQIPFDVGVVVTSHSSESSHSRGCFGSKR